MRWILLLLCAVELWLVTYGSNCAGPLVSPMLLLSAGFAIAIFYLKLSGKKEDSGLNSENVTNTFTNYLSVALFAALSFFIFCKQYKINLAYPLSLEPVHSDVIPLVMHITKRFVNGTFPYTPIPLAHYILYPTYLPFTWLPFCIAELLHFDYRWISLGAYWFVALYYFRSSLSANYRFGSSIEKIIVSAAPLLVWTGVAGDDDTIMGYTAEPLIAAYYLLLVLAIRQKHIAWFSAAAGLCLLSRYSILFWVPLCFFMLMISGKRKSALGMTAIVSIFILLFYGIPFLSHDMSIFKKGYDYYTDAALAEWRVAARENGFWHLGNGLGFTKWMFMGDHGNNWEEQLFLYQKIHIAASLLAVVVLFVIYIFKRYPLKTYLLFSLKIYITVFYAFIQVPYKYLFLVPVMVSSALLLNAYRNQSALQECG